MKFPSFTAVIWCWEERQTITAIPLCGTSTFMLCLPSDCKDNIYICTQITSHIELVLGLQILKLDYFVYILKTWWSGNAEALIKSTAARWFAGPIFRKLPSEHLQTLSNKEIYFIGTFLMKPSIMQQGMKRRAVLVPNVFSSWGAGEALGV